MLILLAQTSSPTAALDGPLGIALLVVALVLAVAWLLLPFMLVSALKKLNREAEAMHAELKGSQQRMQALESLIASATKAAQSGGAIQTEINTTLHKLESHAHRTNELIEWLGRIQQEAAERVS